MRRITIRSWNAGTGPLKDGETLWQALIPPHCSGPVLVTVRPFGDVTFHLKVESGRSIEVEVDEVPS